MRFRNLIAAASVVFAIGCSADPHKVKITNENKDKLLDEIKDMKGLTVGETRMLIGYFMRQGIGKAMGQPGPEMVGKTVGDLIKEQRDFESKAKTEEDRQNALAEEAKRREDARAAELRKAVNLTVYEKGFQKVDYQEYITIKCAFENTSGKDIRAFTGAVAFTDLFGKSIYESHLTISDPVKAGAKGTWDGSINYNQFISEESRLKNSDLKDMKVIWKPASILFADGSSIGEVAEGKEAVR
jgi:hypothetical protein